MILECTFAVTEAGCSTGKVQWRIILRGYTEGPLGISEGTLKEICGIKWYILDD
jgi:hypothetical protein